MRLARTALVAAAASVLALLAGCSHDASASVVDAAGPAHGQRLHLTVPSGTFTVTLGTPVTHLSADDTQDRSTEDAPDGGRYVPVTWSFAPTEVSVVDTTGQKAGLSLVAGGRRYALGTVDRTSTAPRDVYVAVSDASGLAASTTFDGRSVTAHDGDAAVGQESRQVPVACGGWSGGRDVTCTLSAYSTDWVGRWAPQGKHFVVVDAEVELGKQAVHEGSSTTYYEPAAGALRVALQGRGTPTSLPKDPQDPCHFRGRTTLQTALDHPRLSLALTCSMERSGSDGPTHGAAGLQVATRVSVPLP